MTAHRLSKSRYVAGLQCPKMLWWQVHQPDAPELTPGPGRQVIFDRGHRIGELARARFPGGVLINVPFDNGLELKAKVDATAKALADGAPAIYEASFFEDDIFVSVDVLERGKGGAFTLVEVKSTLDVKDAHLNDVAVQLHVVRKAGLRVTKAQVMHLNRDCRHPDLSNLFVRENVASLVRPLLREVPKTARALLDALGGPLPDVATGEHCYAPYPCPFLGRCWPQLPPHHVSTLYRIRSGTAEKLVAEGYETLVQLPFKAAKSPPAKRQLKAVKSGELVVEKSLRRRLRAFKEPLAFLDFETINPAVPLWPGCRPYGMVPVQLSCHRLGPNGVTHHAWLAEGPGDPRPSFARELLWACKGAKTIVAYNASFEQNRISELAQAAPELADELLALNKRFVDLLPVVRDCVYHPDFGGRFTIKSVLPALVPGMGYDDLAIQEGAAASAALEALLLDGDAFEPKERMKLREELLAYCQRDTFAMVKLWERLKELVDG